MENIIFASKVKNIRGRRCGKQIEEVRTVSHAVTDLFGEDRMKRGLEAADRHFALL
jgi:hypothetical protein